MHIDASSWSSLDSSNDVHGNSQKRASKLTRIGVTTGTGAVHSIDGDPCDETDERGCLLLEPRYSFGDLLPVRKVAGKPGLILEDHMFKLPRELYLIVHTKKPAGYTGSARHFVVPRECEREGLYPVAGEGAHKGLFGVKDLFIILRPNGVRFFWLHLHLHVSQPNAPPLVYQLPAATFSSALARLESVYEPSRLSVPARTKPWYNRLRTAIFSRYTACATRSDADVPADVLARFNALKQDLMAMQPQMARRLAGELASAVGETAWLATHPPEPEEMTRDDCGPSDVFGRRLANFQHHPGVFSALHELDGQLWELREVREAWAMAGRACRLDLRDRDGKLEDPDDRDPDERKSLRTRFTQPEVRAAWFKDMICPRTRESKWDPFPVKLKIDETTVLGPHDYSHESVKGRCSDLTRVEDDDFCCYYGFAFCCLDPAKWDAVPYPKKDDLPVATIVERPMRGPWEHVTACWAAEHARAMTHKTLYRSAWDAAAHTYAGMTGEELYTAVGRMRPILFDGGATQAVWDINFCETGRVPRGDCVRHASAAAQILQHDAEANAECGHENSLYSPG